MTAKSTQEQHSAALFAAKLTLESLVPVLNTKDRAQALASVKKYCSWYGKQFVWNELGSVLESKGIVFEDVEGDDHMSILNEDWLNK